MTTLKVTDSTGKPGITLTRADAIVIRNLLEDGVGYYSDASNAMRRLAVTMLDALLHSSQ